MAMVMKTLDWCKKARWQLRWLLVMIDQEGQVQSATEIEFLQIFSSEWRKLILRRKSVVKVSLREIQLILAAARKWLQFRGSGQLSKTDCKTCPIFSEHEMLSCKTALSLQRPLETNHCPPTFPLLTKESFHANNCRKQKKQLRLDMPDQTPRHPFLEEEKLF